MKRLDPKEVPDGAVRDIAAAICIQAADDYKVSLGGKWMKDSYGRRVFMLKLKNKWKPAYCYGIEPPSVYIRFFEGEWFKELSGITNTELAIRFLKATRHQRYFKKI